MSPSSFVFFLTGGLKLVLAATGSFFAVFALAHFFSGFIVGIDISSVVVEAVSEDIILGVEVVVEVMVKVTFGPWPWPRPGGA